MCILTRLQIVLKLILFELLALHLCGQFLNYAEFSQKSTISPSVLTICDACTTFKYEIKQHSINLRQKRVLAWSNSDSLPHLGRLGIPRITEGRWGIWQNYKRISGGTFSLTLLFPAYFWTRFTQGGTNLPPPIKCPIMGGRFQNWVGISYLTEIDARQKDLQLSDTWNHSN